MNNSPRIISICVVYFVSIATLATNVLAATYGSGLYGSGSYAGTPPTITTSAATSITQTGAELHGTIVDIGTTSPTIRGFAYGTSISYGATTTDSAGPFSEGIFSETISGLVCATSYHFLSYATSINGTSYGDDEIFTTSACSSPASAIAVTTTNSGSSAMSRVRNLLAIGQYTLAQQIARQYSIIIPTQDLLVLNTSPTTTPAPIYQTLFTKGLRYGMTGSDIKRLQIFLNSHGFIVAKAGGGSPGYETNYFGPATKAALMRFQEAYKKEVLDPQGLKYPTGFFGMDTMKTVNRIIGVK